MYCNSDQCMYMLYFKLEKNKQKKRMLQGLDAPRIRADAILTGSSVNISLWIQNKIVSQFW